MLVVIGVLLVKVLPIFDDVYASLGGRLTGVAGGLPLEEAVALSAGLLEAGARKRCLDCQKQLEQGESLGNALHTLLPANQCRLLELGQHSGAGDASMEKIARDLTEQGEAALDNLVGRVKPALVLVCSMLVDLILLSVMHIMSAIGWAYEKKGNKASWHHPLGAAISVDRGGSAVMLCRCAGQPGWTADGLMRTDSSWSRLCGGAVWPAMQSTGCIRLIWST